MKTGVIIRTAEVNHRGGKIDAAVVIAYPNGVHRVWEDEWPKDWSEDLPYKVVSWQSGRMTTVKAKAALEELLKFTGFAVLTLNCEAILTKVAEAYLKRFLAKRRVLLVADESSWLQSPSAARTKRAHALSRHPNVIMKRALDGTPSDEEPLNLWSQCAFLDPNLLGHRSFFTFRRRYAVLEEGYAPGGRTFQKVAGYQNLEELRDKLSKFSSRLRRADISDAPPKTYNKRYFQLTPTQREVYDRLRDEYMANLGGEDVPVSHVLTRLIRLQMVSRNYYPPETVGQSCPVCEGQDPECQRCSGFGIIVTETKLRRIDPDRNPAIDALVQELRTDSEPAIVWCKFRQDVTDAVAAAGKLGRKVVRYDGTVSEEEREASYHAFRNGTADCIVGTVESGLSRGKDLTRAGLLCYYSNSYSLRTRRQSEDRAEGLLRDRSTTIVDFVAEDTHDERIIDVMREKRSLAELVMGDPTSLWI